MTIERKNPDRTIAVLLPELVERKWYQYFLHNQRARILEARLLTQGTHRIVIVNVLWYLRVRNVNTGGDRGVRPPNAERSVRSDR